MMGELTPDERLAVAEEAIRSARKGEASTTSEDVDGKRQLEGRTERLLQLAGSMDDASYRAFNEALRDTQRIDGDDW